MNIPKTARASAAFAAALSDALAPRDAPASLLGLEHEYRLASEGRPVDFRDLIHALGVPGQRLDPGDRNAYRLVSGLVLTCDDAEAEIAAPPVHLSAGFTRRIEGWAQAGRDQLDGLLPSGVAVDGFSTHLSAALPSALDGSAAALLARTFALPLMLVMERPESRGVYVRPRPGRLELAGEYLAGRRLGAAAAFYAGAVRLCAAAVAHDTEAAARLPPALNLTLAPARGRYGYYVGRTSAFGFNVYKGGRASLLPRAGGRGTITAQAYLEAAWQAARAALAGNTDPTDLEAMDRIVTGSLPLGVEDGEQGPPSAPEAPSATVYGGVLAVRRRPGFDVSAVVATWDFTVFHIEGTGRDAYACLPRPYLAAFLNRLDDGQLDAALAGYVEAAPAGRVLAEHGQTLAPGLWDVLGPGRGLLAAEPDRGGGSMLLRAGKPVAVEADVRAGKPSPIEGRLGKPLHFGRPSAPSPYQPPRPTPTPSGWSPAPGPAVTPPRARPPTDRLPPKLPLAVAGAIALLVATVAIAAFGSGLLSSGPSAPSEPTPMPTPAVATATLTAPVVVPAVGTLTPSQVPTETPRPTSTLVATVAVATRPPAENTPTALPTLPRDPTLTPTRSANTPSPTPTRTAVPPTRSATPSPTPSRTPVPPSPTCGPPGAVGACTPTPAPTVAPTANPNAVN